MPRSVQPLLAQAVSLAVLRDKYLQPGESSAEDLFARVARALASVEAPEVRADWEQRFRQHLQAGGIGAGRIMAAAGTGADATLINCFVQPLGDCRQGRDPQGWPGLELALREAAHTLRMGGGVGCDFSRVRPRAARAEPGEAQTQAQALGPCGCIDLFERAGAALQGVGARRSAQMAVLRIDHPDVLEFIHAKRTPGRWRHFTVSVAVPDAFFDALAQDADWALLHRAEPGEGVKIATSTERAETADPGPRLGWAAAAAQPVFQRADGLWVYATVPARALWHSVLRAAYDVAEPGVLFIDRMRRDNNLRALETLDATNPCGEQPLPAYGACALGPLILPRFVRHPFGVGGAAQMGFAALARHAQLQVRLLDNVLELTRWPLPQQAQEARLKRRIGVGFTGLADALVMLGLRYDSVAGRTMARRIARCLRNATYAASVELARERGAFPLLDVDTYLAEGTFASRLPAALRARIRRHGIRHSHLLSVAPAGTVSLAFADHCSSGIEPAFAWTGTRRVLQRDGRVSECAVENHAWRVFRSLVGEVSPLPSHLPSHLPPRLPPAFVTATEVQPQDHLAMMQAVQPYVDAAISKTVNLAPGVPYDQLESLYLQAWQQGLKGLTVYRPSALRSAVYEQASVSAGGDSGCSSAEVSANSSSKEPTTRALARLAIGLASAPSTQARSA